MFFGCPSLSPPKKKKSLTLSQVPSQKSNSNFWSRIGHLPTLSQVIVIAEAFSSPKASNSLLKKAWLS